MKFIFMVVIFLAGILLFFSPEINSISVINFNVSVTVSDFFITIVSPLNQTYSISSIDFEVYGSQNISSCTYSFDDFFTNSTMVEVNETYFSNSETLGDGNYHVNFWCNDSFNVISKPPGIDFSVFTGTGSGGGGGGGTPSLPSSNESEENETGILGRLGFPIPEVICTSGECDIENKSSCTDSGTRWEEKGYCKESVCGNEDLEFCGLSAESCGNGKCERYYDEDLLSCFSDCKLKTFTVLNIIMFVIIVGVLGGYLLWKFVKKT